MTISVCVPYWERPQALARMFENYAAVYPDLPLEFSVCDDGSPTPAEVPEGVILNRLLVKTYPRNPCVPINRAVAASHGDVIVLTNPEVEHLEPVLPAMFALLTDESAYVTAACRDADGDWLAGTECRYDRGGRGPVPPGGHFHFCAMFFRRLWNRAGGFDEAYREGQGYDDNDWLWRVYAAGARFQTVPVAVRHTRSGIRWGMRMNDQLFAQKWPEAYRAHLIEKREAR